MKTFHLDTGRIWRGGQRQCCLLCGHLASWGGETHLACPSEAPLKEKCAGAGIDQHDLNPVSALDPVAIGRLSGLLKSIRPEILAAHDAHAFSLLIFARIWSGLDLPLVYHRRVDVPAGRYLFSKWKFGRADLFICVSGLIAQIVAKSGIDEKRIRVVHSGTPGIVPSATGRKEVIAELGLPADTKILGAIGGLIPHKGHTVLLKAMAALLSTRSYAPSGDMPLSLLLIGDGGERASLEQQAKRLNLSEQVYFLGERSDLARLFGAFDLFVHPSLTEGLGTSILDAFSAEVPVVASRTGGIPEMVSQGETGLLAEPGDAISLVATLEQALSQQEKSAAMARRALDLYESSFTDLATAEKTLVCYQELAGVNSSRQD